MRKKKARFKSQPNISKNIHPILLDVLISQAKPRNRKKEVQDQRKEKKIEVKRATTYAREGPFRILLFSLFTSQK